MYFDCPVLCSGAPRTPALSLSIAANPAIGFQEQAHGTGEVTWQTRYFALCLSEEQHSSRPLHGQAAQKPAAALKLVTVNKTLEAF